MQEFDSNDSTLLNTRWLRAQVGLVSQEPVLFDMSIADNIIYGDNSRQVTIEECIAAAKKSNIHDFVDSLPLVSLSSKLHVSLAENQKGVNSRAVYTGIKKKNEFFSHSVFALEVARQLPLNTAKNLNKKPHLWSVFFFNSAGFSLVFCQCKRSLPSRRYYSGFWSRGTWPSAESPVARNVLRTTYSQR